MPNKVSIIMGVFNCSDTLSDALDSILAQTYQNWELILCDDGSTDDTYRVASEYCGRYPGKIVLLQNEKNMGLNHTLNRCLAAATGVYIARMDGDDISLPERLYLEVAFLDAHPEYAIVSCPMIYFDDNGDWGTGTAKERPTALDFVSGTPFCHAPCMVRAEAYTAAHGYSSDPRTLRAEDYDLWFRLYELGYQGYNLQTPLYKMRDDENAYQRRKFKYCLNEAYVRVTGFHRLKIPTTKYVWVLRPIMVGLLPKCLYFELHRKKKLLLQRTSTIC